MPLLEYADFIWADCADREVQLLESIQYEASRVVCGAIKGTSYERLREELGWQKLMTRRFFHKMLFFYKIIHHQLPSFLIDLLPSYTYQRTQFTLRSSNSLFQYILVALKDFITLFCCHLCVCGILLTMM